MRRRQFLSYVLAGFSSPPAIPEVFSSPSGGTNLGDRFVTPSWAPAAGQIKVISYAVRAHPLGRGAVLAEISPSYYD